MNAGEGEEKVGASATTAQSGTQAAQGSGRGAGQQAAHGDTQRQMQAQAAQAGAD